jgi:hypothetical protein
MKTKYKISTGRASWHQQKAGHIFAGELIVSLTPEELETFKANHAKHSPHEPIFVQVMQGGAN